MSNLNVEQVLEARRHVANSLAQQTVSELKGQSAVIEAENAELRERLSAQTVAEGKVFMYLQKKLKDSLAQIASLEARYVKEKRDELKRVHEIDDVGEASSLAKVEELTAVRQKAAEITR